MFLCLYSQFTYAQNSRCAVYACSSLFRCNYLPTYSLFFFLSSPLQPKFLLVAEAWKALVTELENQAVRSQVLQELLHFKTSFARALSQSDISLLGERGTFMAGTCFIHMFIRIHSFFFLRLCIVFCCSFVCVLISDPSLSVPLVSSSDTVPSSNPPANADPTRPFPFVKTISSPEQAADGECVRVTAQSFPGFLSLALQYQVRFPPLHRFLMGV